AQDLLAAQPGADDARRFIAAARTESGDWTVVYTPVGGTIRLNSGVCDGVSARWFDPRDGHWLPAQGSAERDGGMSFATPDDGDWALDLRRA
ncbi:MAG TPA: putative collagen-binding domain-containing protein, partial [Thermomicrobiales bacterium]|nr:putative collagen-binding domain-containing protein [Thermomicrobiales bacterium]